MNVSLELCVFPTDISKSANWVAEASDSSRSIDMHLGSSIE